jgi:chromosome segregation ATPase
MRTYTDLEIAKQLEELSETIEKGIIVAKEGIIKSQEIQNINNEDGKKFAKIKVDIFQIADEVRKTSQFISNSSSDFEHKIRNAENIRDALTSQFTQFENYQANLEQLHQELAVITTNISTAQTQIQQFEQQLLELNQELPQRFAEIKQLASQVTSDKTVILELAQQVQEQVNEVNHASTKIDHLQKMIDLMVNQTEYQLHITKLETENQILANQIQTNKQEIERLHKKWENQSKKQQLFQNWLLGISIMTATTLAVAILH